MRAGRGVLARRGACERAAGVLECVRMCGKRHLENPSRGGGSSPQSAAGPMEPSSSVRGAIDQTSCDRAHNRPARQPESGVVLPAAR